MTQQGIVTESTGSWYKVEIEGVIHDCRTRGRLRLKGFRSTSPVVVGDRVQVEFTEAGEGMIVAIEPRTNYIIRRASNLSKESHIIAANVDCAAVVVTIAAPVTAPEFVDRFLVTCEAYKVPAVIILNKIDTARNHPEKLAEFRHIYTSAGYRIIECSALTGEGVDEVVELLRDKTTLLSGNSGVGKSSILNGIDPTLELSTGEISEKLGRGRHTTRTATLYHFADGYVVDTPGFSSLDMEQVESINKDELAGCFREFAPFEGTCRFIGCAHYREPNCGVRDAVARGEIAQSRYDSYVAMYEAVKDKKEWEK